MYGAGNLIYMNCDKTAKELLKQAENDEKRQLKRSEDDPKRTDLFEKVISILSQDSPTKVVKTEVVSLSQIVACTRKHDEYPREYA